MRLSRTAGPASGRHSVNVCLLIDTDMKVLGKAEQALQSRGLLSGTGWCVPSTDSAKEVLRFLEPRQPRHRESASGGKLTQPNPGGFSSSVLFTFISMRLCEMLPLFPSLAHPNSAKPSMLLGKFVWTLKGVQERIAYRMSFLLSHLKCSERRASVSSLPGGL